MESPFQPINAKSPKYRQSAYLAIKEGLLSGNISFDQPLIEEQIAEALQISRTPVREALAILEHEGLISPRGGRGLALRVLSRRELDERITANELIEPALGRRAAHFITEEQLHGLVETLHREYYEASEGHLARFWSCGREFHRLIGQSAENEPSTEFVARNDELVTLFLLGSGIQFAREAMRMINGQHEAILSALIRRDPDETARLLVVHAQAMREVYGQLLGETEVTESLYSDLARLD